MIQRNGPNDYRRTSVKGVRIKRKIEDFDLRFGEDSIYILGENEWWDPHTSTNYYEGVSRHAMYGPAAIVFYRSGQSGVFNSTEYYVNDPRVWQWVQKCVKSGDFNSTNCEVANQEDIEIKPEQKKVRKKKSSVK